MEHIYDTFIPPLLCDSYGQNDGEKKSVWFFVSCAHELCDTLLSHYCLRPQGFLGVEGVIHETNTKQCRTTERERDAERERGE